MTSLAPTPLAMDASGNPATGWPHFPADPDPLRQWRHTAPGRVAVVDRAADQRITYGELDAGAARWHGLLARQGIARGGRVAVMAENRREILELLFACGRIGAMLVPLNWRLSSAELARVLADARPALVVAEGRWRALAEDACILAHVTEGGSLAHAARGLGIDPGGGAHTVGTPAWIDLDAEAPALLARAGDPPAIVPALPDDPALVLYTSGSTGAPKGAVLPRRQLWWNAYATTTAWELGARDIAPVSTPFFHTGGWNVFALPLLHRGGTVVLFRRFEAGDFLAGLADEACTVAMTVPTQLVMLLEHASWGRRPLPALRFFIVGGAPCPESVGARVRASGLTFRTGYGLTECGPNCFATSDEMAIEKPGAVGWPVPGLAMRLVDDEGRDVTTPDTPGELLLRGPQMFAGYLDNPEKTAEAMTPDGWLRRGDLARRDADGAYTICGRRKEMFISGGENVFPGEVEAALAECDAVAEAVVVGVPDAKWGEVGCAFVVPRAGAARDEGAAQALVAAVRARLAGYKVPRRVVWVDELPRLGSGKVDRRALTDMLAGND